MTAQGAAAATRLPASLDRRFEAVVLVGAGLPDVRASAAAAVEAGVAVVEVDGPDGVGPALDALWADGVGRRGVLVLHGPHPADVDGGTHVRHVRTVAAGTTVACCDGPQAPRGVVQLPPGPESLARVLDDQRARRLRAELPVARGEPGWVLELPGFDLQHERVREALAAVADGRVGTSGALLSEHEGTRRSVLCAGVYDGEDADKHLLAAPVALRLPAALVPDGRARRVLDLRTGVLHEQQTTARGPLAALRFAARARPGTVVLRARSPQPVGDPALDAPDEARVVDRGSADGTAWMQVAASTGGVAAAVCTASVTPARGGEVVDRVAAYLGDPVALPPVAAAVDAARGAARAGFDALLDEQRRAMAARWEDADVAVRGDPGLQLAVRLMLLHLMGGVADEGEAAVGARGLTGPGYSGHVFWDADAFVLPFLAATHPASARAMLEYRVRRLPEALELARARGHRGARFPWESARTGHDVTPPDAYDRGGRLIPVRTGALEEHIVADVAWAASCYLDWTGDRVFAAGGGRQLLVETARYWASRIEVDTAGHGHVRGVIGPDEYHEDVDDDCFTNVMARWNLRRAAQAVAEVPGTDGAAEEAPGWRALADGLVDGYDETTRRHEQFAGFFALEPLVIAEIAPRRPIAADVLMGRDRLQGSQVVKQPAVLMAHHLVPDELPAGSLLADLDYYEPRTAHGSSLSPGVHAALLARAGHLQQALSALEITANIDLQDLTGTTAAGVHLATAGALWQAMVMGFAGVRPAGGALRVDPHVPRSWGVLEVRLRFRGSRVRLRCSADTAEVRAETEVPVLLTGPSGGDPVAGPGGLRLRRRDEGWEVA